jgi:hypothetical protein
LTLKIAPDRRANPKPTLLRDVTKLTNEDLERMITGHLVALDIATRPRMVPGIDITTDLPE